MTQYRTSLFYFIFIRELLSIEAAPHYGHCGQFPQRKCTLAALYMTSSLIDLCKPPSDEPHSMFPCRGTFFIWLSVCVTLELGHGSFTDESSALVETDWTMGTSRAGAPCEHPVSGCLCASRSTTWKTSGQRALEPE